jgi:hypothetical protein
VLDDIGAAFEKWGMFHIENSLVYFIDFCTEISSCFELKNVFFLLLGHSSFLSLIGNRQERLKDHPDQAIEFFKQFHFSYLDFHLLRVGPEFYFELGLMLKGKQSLLNILV